MAYNFQTFVVFEVLTASKMNQVEVNIRDHVHGTAGVGSTASTWNVTGNTFLGATFSAEIGNAANSGIVSCYDPAGGTSYQTLEVASNRGQGNTLLVSLLEFSGNSQAASHKTLATIGVYFQGTTDTQRGGYISFGTKNDGLTAINEVMRLERDGTTSFPLVGTTASAANAFLNNASSPANNLLRSTSSLRYKKLLGLLSLERAQKIVCEARPICFEPIEGGREHIGLAAEWMYEIDPAVTTLDKEGRPDWVQYPHLVAPLMLVVQEQQRRIAVLEARLLQ